MAAVFQKGRKRFRALTLCGNRIIGDGRSWRRMNTDEDFSDLEMSLVVHQDPSHVVSVLEADPEIGHEGAVWCMFWCMFDLRYRAALCRMV